MIKKKLNIAVSGLNATDNPGPGVPVIRSIRESSEFEGTITGLAYDPLDPGIYMRGICDNAFLMPYPSEGSENLLERLKEIHAEVQLDVILPCLDSELGAYLKIDQDLSRMGIKTFLPRADGLQLRSKARLDRLGEKDIRVPKGKPIVDSASVFQLEKEFTFPLLIKGQFYQAYLAYSPMEAEHYFKKISSKWGLPVVVQEYIVGDEYDVVALGDGEGGLIGAVTMKKMHLTENGKAWGGITIDESSMKKFVQDVIRKLKWRGPAELELIKTKDRGIYLIELNPRFPAWCYLAVAAGQNLPWAAVKLALSEPMEELSPYKVGTLFLRNSAEQIYPLSEFQSMTTAGKILR